MLAATDPIGYGLGSAATVVGVLVLAACTVVLVRDTVVLRRANAWPPEPEPLFPTRPCPPGCRCRYSQQVDRGVACDPVPGRTIGLAYERNRQTGHVRIIGPVYPRQP